MSYAATTSRKCWIGRVECPTVHMISIETSVSPTADPHLRAHHCIRAWSVENTRMQLRTLCDLELRYTALESIDFGAEARSTEQWKVPSQASGSPVAVDMSVEHLVCSARGRASCPPQYHPPKPSKR